MQHYIIYLRYFIDIDCITIVLKEYGFECFLFTPLDFEEIFL